MTREFRIADRAVGGAAPAYVIAEAGVNHGCDLPTALRMVQEAAKAGADAIKFQTYDADKLTTKWAPRYWDDPEPSGTQYALFRDSDEFGREEFEELYQTAQEAGIHWLTTPFDLDAVEWLAEMGVPAYKIASADLTNWPLLRACAEKGRPMLMSVGASTLEEVHGAVQHVLETGNDQIALLHCVLCYPSPLEDMNLLCIPRMQDQFPDLPIGLSDHSIPDPGLTVPAAAVTLGAKLVEKHFTLDTSLPGSDHYLSVDPPMLKRMVENIRTVETALGSREVKVFACEEPARKYARRSVVAATDIPAGTPLQPRHLIMKRPGTGVSPTEAHKMLGRITVRDIPDDQLVTWDDLDGDGRTH